MADLSKTFFNYSILCIFAFLLSIYALKAEYHEDQGTDAQVERYYLYYIHVATMIFVGFGFLMTFLAKYAWSSVGFNFLLSLISLLWGAICVAAANNVGEHKGLFAKITVDIPFLINSMFAAGAVMISFGALLGKASPSQLVWFTMLEIPFFALAGYFIDHVFKAADLGGSIAIHAFGAYFGLAVSRVISPICPSHDKHELNKSVYISDVTAMIGTLFLWILWPSFNCSMAPNGSKVVSSASVTTFTNYPWLAPAAAPGPSFAPGPAPFAPVVINFEGQQFRSVINTVLSLTASGLAAFAISGLVDPDSKISMVHIQNATLAGGVAVGSSANLVIEPAGALIIGFLAGAISTIGYAYITPFLEKNIRLGDTCGVHNLHGMPGVLGGLASAVVGVVKFNSNKSIFTHGYHVAGLFQFVALATTLGIAIGGGVLTGLIIKSFDPVPFAIQFDDQVFWVLEEEYQQLGDEPPSTSDYFAVGEA